MISRNLSQFKYIFEHDLFLKIRISMKADQIFEKFVHLNQSTYFQFKLSVKIFISNQYFLILSRPS